MLTRDSGHPPAIMALESVSNAERRYQQISNTPVVLLSRVHKSGGHRPGYKTGVMAQRWQ